MSNGALSFFLCLHFMKKRLSDNNSIQVWKMSASCFFNAVKVWKPMGSCYIHLWPSEINIICTHFPVSISNTHFCLRWSTAEKSGCVPNFRLEIWRKASDIARNVRGDAPNVSEKHNCCPSDLGLVFVQSLVEVQVKWFLCQEVEFLPLEVSRFLVPKIRLSLCIAY